MEQQTRSRLYAHQQEAADSLVKILADRPRTTCVMACGTGKTRVGAEVAGHFGAHGAGHSTIVVPTLELVRQHMAEWADHLGAERMGRVAAVCSDREILAADRSGLRGELAGVRAQVTTDASVLADLSKRPGPLTVACTYASLPILAEAQARHRMTHPNIMIIDEAHRTAGTLGRAWSMVHYDDVIAADRRAYMTATPRILDSEDGNVISMTDQDLYGPVGYRLSFATAIDLGLLARYRLVVPIVTADEARHLIGQDGAFLKVGRSGVSASVLATMIAVLRAAHEYRVRRMITYHRSVAEARWFSVLLPQIHALLPPGQRPVAVAAELVHGNQTVAQRRRALNLLAGDREGLVVVSNSRVLSEGVDVPAVDAVCLLQERGTIDTIQAIGRAMRLSDRSRPKVATVMVPVIPQPGEEPEAALHSSRFGAVWQTVRALASHDETLRGQLDNARRSYPSPAAGLVGGTEGGLPDWLSVTGIPVPDHFAAAIATRTVNTTTNRLLEYEGAAAAYHAEHQNLLVPDDFCTPGGLALGHHIKYLRAQYRQKKLTAEQIATWEALGMMWSFAETRLQIMISEVRKFKELHGHLIIPYTYVTERDGEPYALGEKARAVRKKYGAQQLSPAKASALRAEGFILDHAEFLEEQFISDCLTFKKINGHLDIPLTYTNEGRPVGTRARSYRGRPERLSAGQRAKLDEIGFVWDSNEFRWDAHFAFVSDFKARTGHLNIPSDLAVNEPFPMRPRKWMYIQISAQRKGILSRERYQKLIGIGMEFPEVRRPRAKSTEHAEIR